MIAIFFINVLFGYTGLFYIHSHFLGPDIQHRVGTVKIWLLALPPVLTLLLCKLRHSISLILRLLVHKIKRLVERAIVYFRKVFKDNSKTLISNIVHFLSSTKRGISVSQMKRHNKGTLNSFEFKA